MKKRRHELGLFQKQVASRLEINEWTYITWETDLSKPGIRMWPKVIEFLGYYPFAEPQTLPQQLVAHRRWRGLSRQELAMELGVDEGTLQRWEEGKTKPWDDRLDFVGLAAVAES